MLKYFKSEMVELLTHTNTNTNTYNDKIPYTEIQSYKHCYRLIHSSTNII